MFYLLLEFYKFKCFTHYHKLTGECIKDYSNTIDTWAVINNEKGLSANRPKDSDMPIQYDIVSE
tara:strand:- start:135 stop:326 length:192 start_codon:yes stop_codon:yes gene_type:complete